MPHNAHARKAACKRLARRELQYAQCGRLVAWKVHYINGLRIW